MLLVLCYSFSRPVMRDWRRCSVRCVRRSDVETPRVRNAIPSDRDGKPTSEWQPVGGAANSETMVAAHTRSQRACSRQRVSTMTLLLALRQLGSQGGSSSTLSQSDSTRDLARFTRPLPLVAPLRPANQPSRLSPPSPVPALLRRRKSGERSRPRLKDWSVCDRQRPVETLVGPR